MKHSLKLVMALIATAFLVFGCSSSSGSSDDSGVAAPTVAAATDLAASGGTAPTTEAAAKTLFNDSSSALNAFVATKKPSANVRNSVAQARSTTTTTIPYTFTAAAGTGTVAFTGSIAVTENQTDQQSSITANTLYKNIMAVSESGTIDGVLTNATVSYGGHTYVINGKITNTISQSFSFDYLTGTDTVKLSDAKIYLSYAIGLGVGSAFSVKRTDDGVGAKFIITYAANYSKAGILVTSSGMTAFMNELQNYLASQTATLSVYDDSNNLVFKSTLTQADTYKYSILGD